MTALGKITAAAREAALGSLDPQIVEDVQVESAIGAEGDEVLRVTIILKNGTIDRIDNDRFLSTLLRVKRRLRETGEERQAILSYATTQDIEDHGDPES